MPHVRICTHPSIERRLAEARRFVESAEPAAEVLIVGASREAADELARDVSLRRGATFGLHRFSVLQLASRIASFDLARRGLAPATTLGAEAVAARAAFEARRAGSLRYLAPVAAFRGFAPALAATVRDVRLGGVVLAALGPLGDIGRDLADLTRRYDAELAAARLADRAALLASATAAVKDGRSGFPVAHPIVLLDVAIEASAEAAFVAALASVAPRLMATVPAGDDRTLGVLRALPGADVVSWPDELRENDELTRIRRRLFVFDTPDPEPRFPRTGSSALGARASPPLVAGAPRVAGPAAAAASAVSFFSAPGEGRECVEIARRLLEEAARGVRFDETAVLVRAPYVYAGLIETALGRADIPAYFARGTSSPHPAGRAFLALLACAAEGLSARRFAEYLSLGQVPALDEGGAPPDIEPPWVPANVDEQPLPEPAAAAIPTGQLSLFDVVEAPPRPGEAGLALRETPAASPPDSDAVPVLDGTLRAPWKWEHLLVESAVIEGGRERWQRRLGGLAKELEVRRREIASDEPESPALRRLDRDIRDLDHLRRFALPVIGALVALPSEAPWGTWLDALERLASMVLRRSERVREILTELRPMAAIGPVRIDEVRHVLAERLTLVRDEPPTQRYGGVFVGTPEQARGRAFRVVFAPGLAERVFPQRPRQDPLLLDDLRRSLNAAAAAPDILPLATQADRGRLERTLLRLAAGAATERLHLSYPRMELSESRPRVPSFYALDVERARTGRVPDFEDLADDAFREAGARLAWPAPGDPARAIDATEHDLAVLGRLLRGEVEGEPRGRARYLFALNSTLGRSLRARHVRWDSRGWHKADGLYKPEAAAMDLLQRHRLSARAYSVSALQRFAICPYQFLLSAIHRLEPRKQIAPLEQMDPLTRGHLFHRVQADLVRDLRRRACLPVTDRCLATAFKRLDAVLDRVAEEYRDELVPAIDRVWADEVEAIRADLRGWLHRVADEGGEWTPLHTEFGFGFAPGEGRDPDSRPQPVTLDGKWRLHGVVDLIEERSAGVPATGSAIAGAGLEPRLGSPEGPHQRALRVTDHKTGKPRAPQGVIVGGGEHLQPVLYGAAVEQALGRRVDASRLFYCTAVGRFEERRVQLGATERRHGFEVLEIVDRAIEQGVLVPAPRERVCDWCDFREVCGPWERQRSTRKPAGPLKDLEALRTLP